MADLLYVGKSTNRKLALFGIMVAVLGRVRGVHERDEVGRDELGAHG